MKSFAPKAMRQQTPKTPKPTKTHSLHPESIKWNSTLLSHMSSLSTVEAAEDGKKKGGKEATGDIRLILMGIQCHRTTQKSWKRAGRLHCYFRLMFLLLLRCNPIMTSMKTFLLILILSHTNITIVRENVSITSTRFTNGKRPSRNMNTKNCCISYLFQEISVEEMITSLFAVELYWRVSQDNLHSCAT